MAFKTFTHTKYGGASDLPNPRSTTVIVLFIIVCTHTKPNNYKSVIILTAFTESGKVFAFGRNKYGELGLGHSSSQTVTVPTPIHGLTGIVKVACGLYHSAAIDGELTSWGGLLGSSVPPNYPESDNHEL